jgi:hypothetical protein
VYPLRSDNVVMVSASILIARRSERALSRCTAWAGCLKTGPFLRKKAMTSHQLAKKLLQMPDVLVTVSVGEGDDVEILTTVQEPRTLALVKRSDRWPDFVTYNLNAEGFIYATDLQRAKKVQAVHLGEISE